MKPEIRVMEGESKRIQADFSDSPVLAGKVITIKVYKSKFQNITNTHVPIK
jgi:hypothetical protein